MFAKLKHQLIKNIENEVSLYGAIGTDKEGINVLKLLKNTNIIVNTLRF